jgi:glycosyltransferase involved in cell wall biosynthesis
MMSYRFTVFTPTYNRAHTLPKVYASLQTQTFRDFEWLVVDDGSTDATRTLVESWIAEEKFPIHYCYQKNGHKKTAINHGVREAKGELFLILDSDDEIPSDALKILIEAWQTIPETKRHLFAGVTGLCVDQKGKLVGSTFPQDVYDSDSISIRYEAKVEGEKWGFNTTAIMRQFPFPEDIQGLVPEALIWNRIARHYKMRFINQVVRIYHDEVDSISRSSVISNARGFSVFYNESLCYEWRRWFSDPIGVMKLAANSLRYERHIQENAPRVFEMLQTCGFGAVLLRWIAFPIAYWQYRKDKR